MLRLILAFLCLGIGLQMHAQHSDASAVIDDQVWIPFMETYTSFDAEGYNELHTDNVLRINRDGQRIKVGDEYKSDQISSAQKNLQKGAKRSIEFAFIERIHDGDHGFEVGYYKVTYLSPDGNRYSYGKFHVVLQKLEGQWKILMDADSSLDGSITEEEFSRWDILSLN